jgi:hypothetical protein
MMLFHLFNFQWIEAHVIDENPTQVKIHYKGEFNPNQYSFIEVIEVIEMLSLPWNPKLLFWPLAVFHVCLSPVIRRVPTDP